MIQRKAASERDVHASVPLQTAEWTCPICKQTKSLITTDAGDPTRALLSLKNHLRSASGDGHGQRGKPPEGMVIPEEDFSGCIDVSEETSVL